MNKLSILALLVFCTFGFSQSLVLISPNGGESYTSGQAVQLSWNGVGGIPGVNLEFSLDDGPWLPVGTGGGSGTLTWHIPFIAAACSQVLVRVTATGISNTPSDVSDAYFTIQAAMPDAYEPNNDKAHATLISFGDTIKNAMVMQDTASVYGDKDFYRFIAVAGNLVVLNTTLLPLIDSSNDTVDDGYVMVSLYDSSGVSLYTGFGGLNYNVSASGTYYCRAWTVQNKAARYNLVLSGGNAGTLSIVSPNGGEVFTAGQVVSVSWSRSGTVSSVVLEYSLDNEYWRSIGTGGGSGTLTWHVPYIATTCSQVLMRVTAAGINNPPSDVSDGHFTIQAAAPDAYEPNNDKAHATLISFGDTIKDAMVMQDTASVYGDKDFYKFTAAAGNLVVLSIVEVPLTGYDTMGGGWIMVSLYDSVGTFLCSNYNGLNYNISAAGIYYCRVSTLQNNIAKYNLTLTGGNVGTLSIVSPNGGEVFTAGQAVSVSWSRSGTISSVVLEYSLDNGYWRSIGTGGGSGTLTWHVPFIATTCSQVLVRVTATGINNPPSDVSDGHFTIQAAAPDAYEPNNDKAHATLISFGDTIKDAMVMQDTASVYGDKDFYKFTAVAGNLVVLNTVIVPLTGYDTMGCGWVMVSLYDSIGTFLCSNYNGLNYNVSAAGTYYCRVSTLQNSVVRYNLIGRNFQFKNSDNIRMDTIAVDSSSGSSYNMNIVGAKTSLSISLTLNNRVSGNLNIGSLPNDSIFRSPDSSFQIKAISITASDSLESAIQSADIIIPYVPDSLGGIPETALVVLWYNDSLSKWSPISYTLDTVNHRIIAHTTHFSVYGVFGMTGNTRIEKRVNASPAVFSLNAFPLPANPSVTLSFAVPVRTELTLELFDIKGRKVVELAHGRFIPGFYSAVWGGHGAASGVYFAVLRAEGSVLLKKVLLVR